MEDDKRLSANPSDLALLSTADFGPPAYASTALKPEDKRVRQDASSSVDESLTSKEILSGLSSRNKTGATPLTRYYLQYAIISHMRVIVVI